jgi:hypothetical protein
MERRRAGFKNPETRKKWGRDDMAAIPGIAIAVPPGYKGTPESLVALIKPISGTERDRIKRKGIPIPKQPEVQLYVEWKKGFIVNGKMYLNSFESRSGCRLFWKRETADEILYLKARECEGKYRAAGGRYSSEEPATNYFSTPGPWEGKSKSIKSESVSSSSQRSFISPSILLDKNTTNEETKDTKEESEKESEESEEELEKESDKDLEKDLKTKEESKKELEGKSEKEIKIKKSRRQNRKRKKKERVRREKREKRRRQKEKKEMKEEKKKKKKKKEKKEKERKEREERQKKRNNKQERKHKKGREKNIQKKQKSCPKRIE